MFIIFVRSVFKVPSRLGTHINYSVIHTRAIRSGYYNRLRFERLVIAARATP